MFRTTCKHMNLSTMQFNFNCVFILLLFTLLNNVTVCNGQNFMEEYYFKGEVPGEILFLSVCIIVGTILMRLMQHPRIHLPYVVILLLLGIGMGFLKNHYNFALHYVTVSNLSPKYILLAVLPMLVFRSAIKLDTHIFFRSLLQILIVTMFGMILSALLIAIFMLYTFDYHWSFEVALLFGIILSVIMPFQLLFLLQQLGQFEHFEVFLEGEFLLTAGIGIVLFHLLLIILRGIERTALQITFHIMHYLFPGPLFGFIIGKISNLILKYCTTNYTSEVSLTIAIVFLTYFVAEEVLSISGISALIVLGIIFAGRRSTYKIEKENAVTNFCDLFDHFVSIIIYVTVGIVFVQECKNILRPYDIILVLLTYMICNVSRGLMYLLLYPLISHIGYRLSHKKAIIAVWGGTRGSVSLCLCYIVLRTEGLVLIGKQFIVHVTALVFLSLVINVTTCYPIMKSMGMTATSSAKKATVAVVLRKLMEARKRAIGIIKMDRFLADANWIVVAENSHIKSPFKIDFENKDLDGETYIDLHSTICPDCQNEIPIPATPNELRDMTNEAKLRIFKARKISYWRQYRQGMLSWASVEILVRAVNTAADKDDLSVAVDSLTKYWTVGKLGLCFRRRLVLLFTRTKYQHIPTGRFRKKMYYIAVSPWFGYLIYGTLILNLIPIIWEIVQNPKYFTPVFNALKVLAVLFFLIYLVEFLIKVIAFTFCGYWKSHWNKFDFFILLWAGADVAIDWIFIFTHVADNSTVISLAVTARVFSILRLVRLLRLSHFLIPATLHWMDRALDMKLLKGYEIGRGFVTGEDDVIKVLHYLVENKQIYEETKCILESGRLVVIDQLGTLQNDLPWVAVTVKTKQALHKILNTMTNAVEEQKSEGLLEDLECERLLNSIKKCRKNVMTRLHLVETCPPKALLKEVTWIDGDEFVTDYLLEKSELIALKEGDVIISRGDEPKEIYLMVSGLSKMTYTPNTSSLEKLTEQGALPNADIITGVNFEDAYEDYVVAGNVIGELGILTKRPYDVNLVCVTAIQAYCISLYSMEEAMKLCSDPFQGLQARMWKAIAIRIATYLLLEVPAYQAWSQEKIRTHLERAFVPTLRTTKLFVVTDLMEDVILIEGLVMDANSRNIYRAPAHIPRTVRKLIFIKSSQMDVNFNVETKLMIIPVKEMNEYDVMESEMQGSDLVMSLSSKCLRHTIRSRAPMHMKHRYLHHRSKTSLSISLHKSGSRVYPSPSVVSEERKDVTSVNSHSVSLPPNWQRNQTEWNSSKNFDDAQLNSTNTKSTEAFKEDTLNDMSEQVVGIINELEDIDSDVENEK